MCEKNVSSFFYAVDLDRGSQRVHLLLFRAKYFPAGGLEGGLACALQKV